MTKSPSPSEKQPIRRYQGSAPSHIFTTIIQAKTRKAIPIVAIHSLAVITDISFQRT